MIQTDWKKCDNKKCDLVAWIRLHDTRLDFHVNVCEKHYLEIRRNGLQAEDIKYD